MTKRSKPLNPSGVGALTPSFFTEPKTEADLLRLEILQLRERVAAQSYAITQINRTMRFLVHTLHQPLKPYQRKVTR